MLYIVNAKMHDRRVLPVFIVLCIYTTPVLAEFQQQGAKVVYYNTKFVKSVSIFTTRNSRTAPYYTDFNITSLVSWGNNVTIKLQYYKLKSKSEALALELKTCDMINLKWVREWVEKYSNMSLDTCPLKIGIYRFTRFEVPPKNFPVLVLEKNTDYKSTFLVYVTKTKESILEISMDLIFESQPKTKRNKNQA